MPAHAQLRCRPPAGPAGHTLVEALVVVTLLSLIVAIAVPSLRPADPIKLELAGERIAEALRTARDLAAGTGEIHAVEVYDDSGRIVVSRPDMALATPFQDGVPTDEDWIVRHPVTKQIYDFEVGTGETTRGVQIAGPPFEYAVGARRAVMFDAHGVPLLKEGDNFYLLDDGHAELRLAGQRLDVRLSATVGRVTIE